MLGRFADVMDRQQIGMAAAEVGFEPRQRGDFSSGRIAAAGASSRNHLHRPRLARGPIDRQPHLAETAFADGPHEIEVGRLRKIDCRSCDRPYELSPIERLADRPATRSFDPRGQRPLDRGAGRERSAARIISSGGPSRPNTAPSSRRRRRTFFRA